MKYIDKKTIKQINIEEEFKRLLDKLNDNQFWAYIRSWKDTGEIYETMINWDIATKEYEIKELKKILRIK